MSTAQNKPIFPINNGLAPSTAIGLGPAAIPVTLNFSATQQISFDLTSAMATNRITTLQSLYVDNSLNPYRVTLQFDSTYQKVVIPAYSQGTFPILGKVQGTVNAACGFSYQSPLISGIGVQNISYGGLCYVYLLNVPMPFNVWNCESQNLIVTQALGLNYSQSLTSVGNVAYTNPFTLLAPDANRKNYSFPTAIVTVLYSGSGDLETSYYYYFLQSAASVLAAGYNTAAAITAQDYYSANATGAPPVVTTGNLAYTGEVSCFALVSGGFTSAVFKSTWIASDYTTDTLVTPTGIINPQ